MNESILPLVHQLASHCQSAAEGIFHDCTTALSTSSPKNCTPDPSSTGLAGCDEPLIQLLQRQAGAVSSLYRGGNGCEDETNVGSSDGQGERKRLLLLRLDDLSSIAYGKFYAYLFKDLPVCWRQLYTDASILKFCVLVLSCSGVCCQYEATGEVVGAGVAEGGRKEALVGLDAMVKTLDLALILAGAAGDRRGRAWIDRAFLLLEEVWKRSMEQIAAAGVVEEEGGRGRDGTRPEKKRKLAEGIAYDDNLWQDTHSFSTAEPFTPPVTNPVRRSGPMAMEEFQSYLDRPTESGRGRPEPLVISGMIDEWPARRTHHWNKPTYLLSRTFGGRRLVPVEIGRSYVDEGWSQKLISFGEFLHDYIDPELTSNRSTSGTSNKPAGLENHPQTESNRPGKIAYLAQHQLLTQLPLLRNDILIPDLCYTLPPPHPTDPAQNQPELGSTQLNAWFGPPGTITPLHTDPYHNLLVQVVGRKYVRLYPPWETERMRPRGKEAGVEMGNTSLVDVGVVEGWDGDRAGDGVADDYYEFKKVRYLDCILEPGDTLYIPIGWWHYVRGLSVSFSVSFWWN